MEYKIEYVEIDKLKFWEDNPRTITENELEGLKKSIEVNGLIQPIIVNKNNDRIVGGHQRTRAAKSLGWKKVPVIWVELSPTQEKQLNITLNNPAIAGKYDQLKLEELLQELKIEIPELYVELRMEELEETDLSEFEDDSLGDMDTESENAVITMPISHWNIVQKEVEDIFTTNGVEWNVKG